MTIPARTPRRRRIIRTHSSGWIFHAAGDAVTEVIIPSRLIELIRNSIFDIEDIAEFFSGRSVWKIE